MDSSFLFYFLLSQAEKLQRMGTGSTVKGISVALVKSLEMTIPPDAEQQKKITKTLKNSDLKIEILNSKLSNLKTERAALMQQLLTGNRRVKVDQ